MKKLSGFVDLQFNGYLGVDYSSADLEEEDFVRTATELLKKGTCAFLPTVITSDAAAYKHVLPLIAKAMQYPEFKGRILGIHAEGPFLSPEPGAVGAHNPDWVKPCDIDFFKRMLEWSEGNIRILTLAAESENAPELIKYAVSQGVAVSLGHHLADSEAVKRAADAGATLLTHLGNGVPNTINRHHNPIWAGLGEERLSAMIITDSHHLPADVVRSFVAAKGAEKIIVTSDASSMAGMAPGRYRSMNNLIVLEESGLLHNPEKQCLVGSSAVMLECMNFLASLNILSYSELLEVGYFNPLRAINIDPDSLNFANKVIYDKTANTFSCM